jgi:dipeptidyl aminopeptidase/acylaminoacyl peptidase
MTMDTATSLSFSLTVAHVTGLIHPLDPQVSPDGRRVAYTAQAVSRTKKQKLPRAAIWVAPVDGSTPARRWTPGTSNDHSPRWSPDGRWLAFLSDRAEEGKHQLYRLPVGGGEAERLTDWKGGISAFAWSPDSARLAFTAADESWAEERKQREESGDDGEVWGERLGHHRLRVLAPGGGVVTLGPQDRHVTDFSWSPSEREIAAAFTARPDLEAWAEGGVDVVRLPADGGTSRTVCHVPLRADQLVWTADQAVLLYLNWESECVPSSRAIFAVSADGGAPRCLTRGLEGCVLSLARPHGSRTVLCTVAEGLTTRVYELDPGTGRLTLRWQPVRGSATGDLGADTAGRVFALVCSAGDTPPQVWSGDPAAGLRPISDCNPALRGMPWAEQEPFLWTAPDGLALDGLLLRPPGATSTPPGVVLVHGGPYARFTDGFNCTPGTWAQWLALDGYAVFLPNPRGGMGHGHAFADTVAGEVGMADWLDVASGTDTFVARGHADRERLGIGGWSQGGFMTAWAVTGGIPEDSGARSWNEDFTRWHAVSGDRFRAGIMGAGVSDWGAMVSESDLPTFEAMLGGSRPGDGPGPLRHQVTSPISYAARLRTPLLILHGRNDERVPVGQATGFFRELRRRNVPAQMVLYPREPHGVQEEPHVADIQRRVRDWFGRWVKDPTP